MRPRDPLPYVHWVALAALALAGVAWAFSASAGILGTAVRYGTVAGGALLGIAGLVWGRRAAAYDSPGRVLPGLIFGTAGLGGIVWFAVPAPWGPRVAVAVLAAGALLAAWAALRWMREEG